MVSFTFFVVVVFSLFFFVVVFVVSVVFVVVVFVFVVVLGFFQYEASSTVRGDEGFIKRKQAGQKRER